MSPTEAANKVKVQLLEVVEAMNDASKLGVKIEFNLATDAITHQTTLGHFHAWQEMKLNS